MTIIFDHPGLLLLALLAGPAVVLGLLATPSMDRARRISVLVGRAVVLVLLAVALAGPSIERTHDEMTVIAVIDISGSVRRFADLPDLPRAPDELVGNERELRGGTAARYVGWVERWLDVAVEPKRPRDRLGLVVFDGDATAVLAPVAGRPPQPVLDQRTGDGTDIEGALRLALAMLPRDTAGRIVLLSDGNETVGRALAAAELAAAGRDVTFEAGSWAGIEGGASSAPGPSPGARPGPAAAITAGATASATPGIPIDVLPVVYRLVGDVRVVDVVAPTTARPGQTVAVRVLLEATQRSRGQLLARVENVPVDLAPGRPGRGRRVDLPAGRTAVVLEVPLGTMPINRIDVSYVPDDDVPDALPENDRATAVTSTPGRGRTLVVQRATRPSPIPGILRDAGIEVETIEAFQLPQDLLALQDHDLVVLDDISASEVAPAAQVALTRHVEDLGGGLLVVGGERSFGAGGWARTPLAGVLPLELDPPKDVILPTAALVLVLDQSGSMARSVAGARASQQEVANEAAALAIESLRRESFVGVISFASFASTVVPLDRNDDPAAAADAVRGISPGGGTNIEGGLSAAERMLVASPADRRFIVLLTDGRSSPAGIEATARRLAAEDIRVTTIGIGDDVDETMLTNIAAIGGGEFIRVMNPQSLPRVLVDTVQVVNRPLIKEGRFTPQLRATGSTIAADLAGVPDLGGIVVTAPRDDVTAVVEAAHPDGEPLLARWQAGLGRVVAFTSDFGGPWSAGWPADAEARAFWLRLARETTRPRTGDAADLALAIEDGMLTLAVEAADDDGPLDDLSIAGTIFGPGDPRPVTLRQTGPGRYEASVPLGGDGEYVVALAPRRGRQSLPPIVGGIASRSGAEFERLDSDLDLLDAIVDATGGRRLDPADPLAADLFDRTGMPPTTSLRPIWPLVVAWLLTAYLLDVATRRVAWSGTAVRARIRERVAMSRGRGGRATAAVQTAGALRSAAGGRRETGAPATPDSYAAGQRDRAAPGRGRAPGAVPPAAKSPVGGSPAAPATGDPGDAPTVTAPGSPSPAPAPAATPAPASEPTPPPADPPEPAANETTGGLLAAKRRARERLDGGSGEGR